ncbi:AAA family ATPase [Glutamicibacter arilaitensis]|uniref:AAA family ATPase n=1 Tax=Glutamicibacter arilaitensis TaxID=256701 RepID=UPI00384D2CCF
MFTSEKHFTPLWAQLAQADLKRKMVLMITGIELCGRGIVEPTKLTFFPERNQRISVVFGRNGSGKTTIGEGFAQYSVERQEIDESDHEIDFTSTLLVGGQNEKTIPAQAIAQTLVFNESFIESNVRIQDDGIRALVLFGKSGQAQDDLDQAIDRRNGIDKQCEESASVYEAALNVVSRSEAALSDQLRKGWAERERRIKGNRNNSRVNKQVLDRFSSMPLPAETIDELRNAFQIAEAELQSSRSGDLIVENVPTFDLDGLQAIFNDQIFAAFLDAPTGEGLSKQVAFALEHHGALVSEAKKIFENEHPTHCPLCQQAVSEDHRKLLLDAIAAAVDEPAKLFLAKLDKRLVRKLEIELSRSLYLLDELLGEKIQRLVAEIDQVIREWNMSVQAKKNRLYSPMDVDFSKIHTLLMTLHKDLSTLGSKKIKWNENVNNVRKLERKALVTNDRLTRAEVKVSLSSYEHATEEATSKLRYVDGYKRELERCDVEVAKLTSALRSEGVAADEINRNIATVFADSSRLKIVVDGDILASGKFRIKSRGRYLKPHRLSVGERNILALCYYFTLLRQCITEDLDLNKTMLVLDDPISSVDVDNRVGILSFIESQCGGLLQSARGLKILMLTHDVGIFQDLGKTSKAILEQIADETKDTWKVVPWLLRNTGNNDEIQVSLREGGKSFDEPLHEYRTLLKFIYNFAQDHETPHESELEAISIGNALRRVFEAFGVFIYGQKSITSSAIIKAYEALGIGTLSVPIRQALVSVMHGGSHQKDRMLSLADFGAASTIERNEQVIVARKILALMSALQPHHMSHYLTVESSKDLEQWINDYLRLPIDSRRDSDVAVSVETDSASMGTGS